MQLDKLEQIFELHRGLMAKMEKRKQYKALTDFQKIERMALALVKEANELHDLTGWKPWKNPGIIDRDEALEELADVLHFVVEVCIRLKIRPIDLYEAYVIKNKENHARQDGMSIREGYAETHVAEEVGEMMG